MHAASHESSRQNEKESSNAGGHTSTISRRNRSLDNGAQKGATEEPVPSLAEKLFLCHKVNISTPAQDPADDGIGIAPGEVVCVKGGLSKGASDGIVGIAKHETAIAGHQDVNNVLPSGTRLNEAILIRAVLHGVGPCMHLESKE